MDRFEGLQAAIAEHKRRWTSKYGWVPREACRYPTLEEEERRELEAEWSREAAACVRMHIANARKVEDNENLATSVATFDTAEIVVTEVAADRPTLPGPPRHPYRPFGFP